MSKIIGKRIKDERNLLELTQEDLAEQMNTKFNIKINKGMISKWENNREEPSLPNIRFLSNFFNVSMAYIVGDSDIKDKENKDLSNIIPLKTKKVPLLGEIVAGKPKYIDENFEYYIEANDIIKADFCLKVVGDSMINARIYDGDIVFIKEQPDVYDGEIAAVRIDDEATLKRVYKMPGRIQLRAENPAYEPIDITEGDGKDIEILGKAVAFQSKVR